MTDPLTLTDLTSLRAVAEAATPGPWQIKCSVRDEVLDEHGDSVASRLPHPDAEFIATFDPPTVAALIDRVERAERERDEQRVRKDIARRAESEMELRLLALRAAVAGLADEWDGIETWPNEQGVFEQCAAQVRAVLAPEDEGADDGQ